MFNDPARQRPALPQARADSKVAVEAVAISASNPVADPAGALGARPVALGQAAAASQRPAREDPAQSSASSGLPPAQALEALARLELDRLRGRPRDPDAKGSPQALPSPLPAVGLVRGSLQEVQCADGQPAWRGQWRFSEGAAAQPVLFHPDDLQPASPQSLKRAGVQEPPGGWHRHELAAWRLNELLGLQVVARGEAATVQGCPGWVQRMPPGLSPMARGRVQMPVPAALIRAIRARPHVAHGVLREQRYSGSRLDSDHALSIERDPAPVEQPEADLPPDAILVPLDYDDPVLRRGLNTLQWFDALIGHPGRKSGAYHVCLDATGRVQAVVATRNAMGFGHDASSKLHLSPVIDRALARALLDVDAKAIRRALADLLPPKALAGLFERLAAIQVHVSRIAERHHFGKASGLLEGDAQWASPGAGLLLGVPGPDAFKDFGRFKAESKEEVMPAQGLERTDEVRAALAARRKQAARLGYLAREAEIQAQVMWWSAGPLRTKVPPGIPIVADPRPLAVALGVALDGARPEAGEAGDRKENKGASPRASDEQESA